MDSIVKSAATLIDEESNGTGPAEVGLQFQAASSHAGWTLARLIWDHRCVLRNIAFVACPLAIMIAFVIPKQYVSTTRLMPPDSQSSGAAMLAAMVSKSFPVGAYAGELLGVKSSGALFVNLLHSRTVQDRLVDRFNLQRVYRDRYRQDARRDLEKRTDIAEDRKSGVISIAVTDRRPERAAQMAQAYVDELDRLVAEVSTSSARQERIFIEQRLRNVRADLDQAERTFSEFASKNTVLDIKEQTRAMVESAATLQGQLIAAQSELQGMEAIYTGNNVRVRSLRARIAELQHQLQKLGGSGGTRNASANEPAELYPSIRKLPLLGVEWADLYRQTKVQETVYELLTQQYELARIEEAKEVPVVHVVDAANIPEKKSFPPRLLIILSITLVSMLAGAAWILVSASWMDTDPRDPRKALAQEVFVTTKSQFLRAMKTCRVLSLRPSRPGSNSEPHDPASEIKHLNEKALS